ncbi:MULTISPECIES: hypothetical protein [Caldisericum]|uniref:hypothetical protein n=1 Tax=Caldisericum TaxID=693074 RepID=UPI003C7752DF
MLNGKHGYADKKGNFVIRNIFDFANDFRRVLRLSYYIMIGYIWTKKKHNFSKEYLFIIIHF